MSCLFFKVAPLPTVLGRSFRATPSLPHEDESLKDAPETITVHFVTKDGEKKAAKAKEGECALYLGWEK